MVFDIIFIIIFLWAIYKGYSRGFILQAATLAALILGIYGAIKFSGLTATIIIEKLHFNWEYMHLIAFAVTFIGIVIGIHFLARLFEKLLQAISLNLANRLLGVVFSMLKYAFIISAVLVVINGINRRTRFIPREQIDQSILYRPLSMLAPLLFPYLHFDFTHPLDVPDEPDEEIIV
ncbi:MAG: CvpA family protein [Bacteroidales bacterium]|jgi:membrane protein required for colicin V production